jgi:hypothetical protein
MAALSNLRPSKEAVAQFTRTYSSHRPVIQRVLSAGCVLYALGVTYRSFSARPSSEPIAKKSKGKGKQAAGPTSGRPPRVAVRFASSAHSSTKFILGTQGRCRLLRKTVNDSADCYPAITVQGGHASCHALELAHLPHCHLALCRRAGWKVSCLARNFCHHLS